MACLELGEGTGTRIPPNDRTATVPVNDAFIHLRAFLHSFLAKHVALLARSVRCLESDTVALDAMELRPAQDPHTSPCAIPGSRAEVHQRTKHPDVQAREQVASRPWRPQGHPRTSLPSQTDVLNLAAQLLIRNKTCLVVLDTAFTRDVILSKRDGLPKASGIAKDLKHVLSHLCGKRVTICA